MEAAATARSRSLATSISMSRYSRQCRCAALISADDRDGQAHADNPAHRRAGPDRQHHRQRVQVQRALDEARVDDVVLQHPKCQRGTAGRRRHGPAPPQWRRRRRRWARPAAPPPAARRQGPACRDKAGGVREADPAESADDGGRQRLCPRVRGHQSVEVAQELVASPSQVWCRQHARRRSPEAMPPCQQYECDHGHCRKPWHEALISASSAPSERTSISRPRVTRRVMAPIEDSTAAGKPSDSCHPSVACS